MAASLEQIAKKFEPRIRNALLAAFNEIRNEVTLGQIENAIRIAGVNGAYQVLAELQIEGIIEKHLVDELNQAINESGRFTIELIPAGAQTAVPYRYNLLAPGTVDHINRYEFNLIQRISTNTREAIRNAVDASFIAGANPLSTARDFRNTIGLTPKQEQAVRNYRSYLENLDPVALERLLRDKRFDSTIERAIDQEQPLTKKQIDRFVKRYRERYIKYRSEVIARTEALRATSVGEYTGLSQGVATGAIDRERVKRFWVHSQTGVRDAHLAIPKLNPDGVFIDQPFQTPLGPLLYPRDPNGSAANTIQCLHPDSVIDYASPNKLIRRRYQGQMITIKTKTGNQITVTPNHPILWEHGWIRADALKKGDRVVCTGFSDWDSSVHNIKDSITPVEQVYNFFSPYAITMRNGSAVVDFHGEFTYEDIDIVLLDGRLRDTIDSFFSDPFKKFNFSFADEPFVFTSGYRRFFDLFLRINSLRIGPSDIFQNSVKDSLRDIERFFQFCRGSAIEIECSDVIDIHKFNYSGYVYNLEDDKSYYICNGFVNKNCRCRIRYELA